MSSLSFQLADLLPLLTHNPYITNYLGRVLENKIKGKTESLYWGYLYLNYGKIHYRNVVFYIEDYIED